MRKLILRFTGDKESLHKQLKIWCVESEQSMNGLVISLIEKHLKNKTKKCIIQKPTSEEDY